MKTIIIKHYVNGEKISEKTVLLTDEESENMNKKCGCGETG